MNFGWSGIIFGSPVQLEEPLCLKNAWRRREGMRERESMKKGGRNVQGMRKRHRVSG